MLLLVCASAAQASFTVDSTTDAHDGSATDGVCATNASDTGGVARCTLRAAVEQANASAGADTVNIPSGSYGLTLGTLDETDDLALVGTGGARVTTIDAKPPEPCTHHSQQRLHDEHLRAHARQRTRGCRQRARAADHQ